MNPKAETTRTYDKYADAFEEVAEGAKHIVIKQADHFLQFLKGKKILDLGSGPGTYGKYFAEKGFDVICIDISESMIQKCSEKGLKAEVMDIEDLKFQKESFDGVWAYASLLHVQKNNIKSAMKNIHNIIRPEGILAVAVKKGESEGYQETEIYPGTKRWFSLYTDEEFTGLARGLFKIEYSETEGPGWLSYVMRKI